MKYTCSIEIVAPIDKVVELWQDESHFKDWQDGFISIKLIEGNHNEVGAKSRIILNSKFKIELKETILSINLPYEKKALYEHTHMTNTQTSRFERLKNGNTIYTSEVEYVKFNGLIIKLMAYLFPGKFKQQSQKWMEQFKRFVEDNQSKTLCA